MRHDRDDAPEQADADRLTIARNHHHFAAEAWTGYTQRGRGALVIYELSTPAVGISAPEGMRAALGTLEYLELENEVGWPTAATRRMVESYDPAREMVVIFVGAPGLRIYQARIASHPTA